MKLQAAVPSEPTDIGSIAITVKGLPEVETPAPSGIWESVFSFRPVERAMTRRFRPNETLSDVFNWIDASGAVDFDKFLFKLDHPRISIK